MLKRNSTVCSIIFFLWICLISSSQAAEIAWKVVNRFPVFKEDTVFAEIETAKPASESIRDFLLRQPSGELRRLLPVENTWWVANDALYDKRGFFNPIHKISATYADKNSSDSEICRWEMSGQRNLLQPCSQAAVFVVAESTKFRITVTPEQSHRATIEGEVVPELIVGFGDSFSSGEGNPDNPAIFSAAANSLADPRWFLKSKAVESYFQEGAVWWDAACHRSLLSWQGLFAIERAFADPHKIVRFASFACSGAEIYDGFFRAQLSPPGRNSAGISNDGSRDGGHGYTWQTSADGDISGVDLVRNGTYKLNWKEKFPALKKSQLNAALNLLCDNVESASTEKTRYKPPQSILNFKVIYGDFEYLKCNGQLRKPDIVLLSFGGNDFGFSGVVKWGLMNEIFNTKTINPVKILRLRIVKEQANLIDPKLGGIQVKTTLPTLYEHLDRAFSELLQVRDNTYIASLMYPDPLPSSDYQACEYRLDLGNEALSQYASELGAGSTNELRFKVNEATARAIRQLYILPLRETQAESINQLNQRNRLRWHLLDSQRAFTAKSSVQTICSISSSCNEKQCPIPDRFGWEDGTGKMALPALKFTSDWIPYAESRSRGLRTANDAVMTSANFLEPHKKSELSDEWTMGVAHPTADVHAKIAAELLGCVGGTNACK